MTAQQKIFSSTLVAAQQTDNLLINDLSSDIQLSKQQNKKHSKCRKCCIALWFCLSFIGLVILAIPLYLTQNDFEQCQRSCQMNECSDYKCFLQFLSTTIRSGNKCRCGTYEITRLIPKMNTIPFDATDNEYCRCIDGVCNTVIGKPLNYLHKGACGACSSAQDYDVYVKTRLNLTQFSAAAAISSIYSKQKAKKTMTDIGFTEDCAECWVGNMLNTLVHCIQVCAFGSRASCGPDGHLTDCLQCDEDYSGMYFRRCAGMTRRRAGIVSDICRQQGEIVIK